MMENTTVVFRFLGRTTPYRKETIEEWFDRLKGPLLRRLSEKCMKSFM